MRRGPSADIVAEEYHRFSGRILRHLIQLLGRGVLAVRDGGDPGGNVLQYKTGPDRGDLPVHLCAASKARHRPGRYGRLIGSALPVDRTLAETILQEKSDKEIGVADVGQLVMNRLRELDKVAYVRFASVYREFKDVAEFKQVLENLMKEK